MLSKVALLNLKVGITTAVLNGVLKSGKNMYGVLESEEIVIFNFNEMSIATPSKATSV